MMAGAGTIMLAAGLLVAALCCTARAGVALNELRVDQPGTDLDEYFELVGDPMGSLAGVALVVIGDGVGLSGCVDAVVWLDGHALRADGFLLVAQPQMTLGTPDVVAPLEFENSDNLTFMLVEGFAGAVGDDLDLDDDGVLDVVAWTALLDGVAIVEDIASPPMGSEWWYAASIGPGANGNVPHHIRRCPQTGEWMIGPDDPAAGIDTAGKSNGACPIDATPCPSDLNGDTIVDGGDLAILLLNWGLFGDPRKGGGNLAADLDHNGVVDGLDLGMLLLNWNWCGSG